MANRESVMTRVAKLLALAGDAGATEAERERAQALADRLMGEHMIERAELSPEQKSRITCDTWEVATYKAGEFDGHVIALMESVTRHAGCRGTGTWKWEPKGYSYSYKVVGYPEDIAYAEKIFYRSFLDFVSNIQPQWDSSKSLGENVYVHRNAGFKWNEIWVRAYRAGQHPVDPYSGKDEGRRLGRALKAECERRGEPVKRGTQTHKAYRLSYAGGFRSRIGARLEALRKGTEEQISDKDKFLLARRSTDEEVEAEFYRMFPEFDPEVQRRKEAERIRKAKAQWDALSPAEQQAQREAERKEQQRREAEARKHYRRVRSAAATYDPSGWEHGTKIANTVDLNNNKAAGDKKKEVGA